MSNIFSFFVDGLPQYSYIILWIVVFVFLVIVEATTAQMVCIWFIIGSVPALILASFNLGFVYQIAAFVVFSLIAFIVTKPFLKKLMRKQTEKTNVDTLIDATGVVVKDIQADLMGEVSINYQVWNAISENNMPIPTGTKVTIVEVMGNKLVVKEKID